MNCSTVFLAVSAAAMGLSHGMNDAQKTMGIIALALASATAAGTLEHLPSWLEFMRIGADASRRRASAR